MSDNGRWFMNAYLNILLSQTESAAGVSLIEHDMLGGFFVPPHVHHHEDETFYILEGSFRFMLDGQISELASGATLHVKGGRTHAFKVLSPRGRFLTITNGRFESMVREASVAAERPEIPPQVPFAAEDQQRLFALCNRNGIEFVGPPID
ncbi:cupin domain-containing protein [Ciceribacter sp. L1K22]|uniref:cupin domain-containing protein n=1 Tax=Ciceribacter sp. L1K22 TaxID=2820275 RepID=UPI001ABDABF3|nr:cupin domain-containing protein [Ciceribacter sp. L1K22]MBO3759584.1 cupin domain-containing protein [Ciceribacter sp. L1K22]